MRKVGMIGKIEVMELDGLPDDTAYLVSNATPVKQVLTLKFKPSPYKFEYSWRDDPRYFRFIGRDGSMGYRTGKVYHLGVIFHESGRYPNGLTIYRLGWRGWLDKGYCPYENEQAFWDNWEPAR